VGVNAAITKAVFLEPGNMLTTALNIS